VSSRNPGCRTRGVTRSTCPLRKAAASTACVGVNRIGDSWSPWSPCSASKVSTSPARGPVTETRNGRAPSAPSVSARHRDRTTHTAQP